MRQRGPEEKGDPSIRLTPEIAAREAFPFHPPEVVVYFVLGQGKRVSGPTCWHMGEPANGVHAGT
jgi:hypothetical protein